MSNAFAWILTLAVLAGLAWLLLPAASQPRSVKQPDSSRRWTAFDAGLVALVGGLLGARVGFGLTHSGYFSQDVWEIVRLWRGGLSGPGALVGAVCGLGVYAVVTHQRFWPLADALAAPALWVASAAWLGCLVDACAFGLPSSGPLALPVAPGLMGVRLPRWPTQVAGAMICLAALLFLLRRAPSSPATGIPAAIAILCLSLSGLGLSFLRGDPAPIWAGMRLDALAWAATGVAGVLAIGLSRKAVDRG